jgi:hypothetical protein
MTPAAALEMLAQHASGEEIPYLCLRANDWVEPVASELLLGRLRPENRHAVLHALPFIIRMLGQNRRDHCEVERALTSVLLSDGGTDALACVAQFDRLVRRKMFELLTAGGGASGRRFLNAATHDPDAVIRARAIRAIASDADFDGRAAISRAPCSRNLAAFSSRYEQPGRTEHSLIPQPAVGREAIER